MPDLFVGEGELTELLDRIDQMWAKLPRKDRGRYRKNAYRAQMMASSINDKIDDAVQAGRNESTVA